MHPFLPSLVAAACALATATTAHAQASPQTAKVSLFGTANVQAETVQATGAANPAQDKPARWRVSNVSSDLGVKASLPLSDKLTGVFQYVTGVSVENGSGGTNGGLWASAKDAFVGLRIQDLGTVKLGRLTAAARWNSGTPDFSPAGAGPQDDQAALAGVSGQTGAAPQFNVRFDNAIGFESASFGGLSLRAYFSANEGRSNAQVSSGARLNDSSWSLGLQYVKGPLDLRLSHELRNDKGTLNNSTTSDTEDRDTRVGLRYQLGSGTTLALGYDRMDLRDASATGSAKRSLRKSGWVIGAKQAFGAHAFYGGYGHAGDLRCELASAAACNGSSTGMQQWVLAYNYQFHPDMLLEAFVTQLRNQSRAKYDFDSGGIGPGTGAKLSAAGIGLRYSF
ncbi:porin [Aquabacterium sp.]|uniref:porin n=1 Tax=Aquabacterium sp. TaxID=1872578 RepID=UPI00378459BE